MPSPNPTIHPSGRDVTVVIPAYNREDTIERSLQSVLTQTIKPAEILVVDDASADRTVNIARALGVRVLANEVNRGSGPARDDGIRAAHTTWIAFLDADDTWEPGHLATLLDAADDNVLVCSAGVSTSGVLLGNPTGTPLSLDPRLVLETSSLIATSACMVRRDALLAAGSFRPLRRAQDLDMWLRVLDGGPGLALPDRTMTYFEHAAQASKDRDLTLQCFEQILDWCEMRPWFDGRRDRDRAMARVKWDSLRSAQFAGDRRAMKHDAVWFLQRPHAWVPLFRLLRLRRAGRRGQSALPEIQRP